MTTQESMLLENKEDPLQDLNIGMCPLDELRDKLRQVEGKNIAYHSKIRSLEKELASKLAEKNDAFYFYNKKLDDNFEAKLEMEHQIVLEGTGMELDLFNYQKELEKFKCESEKTLEPLRLSVKHLEDELAAHQEIALQKREMEATRQQLIEELKYTKEKHRNEYELETRKGVQEREILQKQMDKKLESAKLELESQKNAEINRQKIEAEQANQRLQEALRLKSAEAEIIMQKTQIEMNKYKTLQNEMSLARDRVAMLEKRVAALQKASEKLEKQIGPNSSVAETETQGFKCIITEKFAELDGNSLCSEITMPNELELPEIRTKRERKKILSKKVDHGAKKFQFPEFATIDELRNYIEEVKESHKFLKKKSTQLRKKIKSLEETENQELDENEILKNRILDEVYMLIDEKNPSSCVHTELPQWLNCHNTKSIDSSLKSQYSSERTAKEIFRNQEEILMELSSTRDGLDEIVSRVVEGIRQFQIESYGLCGNKRSESKDHSTFSA